MKLIIAGGRDFFLGPIEYQVLDYIHSLYNVTEVVSGGARGVDACGEAWATDHKIPIKIFPPEWHKDGKAAGPIRNEKMAVYADACVCFTGGQGTNSMAGTAASYGLILFDFRQRTKTQDLVEIHPPS